VVWAARLPDWSNSSPVISKGRVFVCAEPSKLVCLGASDGKILWEKSNTYEEALGPEEVARWRENQKKADGLNQQVMPTDEALIKAKRELRAKPEDSELKKKVEELTKKRNELRAQLQALGDPQMPGTHPENGYSSCTPTTDGKLVYALFGSGLAACYDFDGNRKWIKFVEKPAAGWGQSSSPLLVGDKLLILINSLTALNAATGEQLWRAPSPQRWGSPVAARVGDADVVVTPGGDVIAVADGKVIAGGLATLDYCAPVVENGIAYFIQHGGKAIRLNGDKPETLWQTSPVNERYYASPVIHDGLIYAVMQHGEFSVIDAKDGKVVHQRKLSLGGTAYSSVTLAKNLLFVTGENGTTMVLQTGREPKEIARNQLERFKSCPVFVGNLMYVRAREKLYCIEAR
jgi:outer membrane protein assembly factor BamB